MLIKFVTITVTAKNALQYITFLIKTVIVVLEGDTNHK